MKAFTRVFNDNRLQRAYYKALELLMYGIGAEHFSADDLTLSERSEVWSAAERNFQKAIA